MDEWRLWNNFMQKSYTNDMERFEEANETERTGAVLGSLYSVCASGDGWEYFFGSLSYYKIDLRYAVSLLEERLEDSLISNMRQAMDLYNENGEEGDYDSLNSVLFSYENFLEMAVKNFIKENVGLYREVESDGFFEDLSEKLLSEQRLLKIENIFTVSSRSSILSGRLLHSVRVGERVFIGGKAYTVEGIECSGRIKRSAKAGENAGLLFKAELENISVGDCILFIEGKKRESIFKRLFGKNKNN